MQRLTSRYRNTVKVMPWLLAVALLVMQLGTLRHQEDLAAHHAGEVCQVCLHASAHGHATVPMPPDLGPTGSDVVEFSLPARPEGRRPFIVFGARAPPIFSVVS